jgi:subtilisin
MLDEYILLPERGVRVPSERPDIKALMSMMAGARSTARPLLMREIPRVPPIEVIDSINKEGPKLVRASQEAALALRHHGLRLVPIIPYKTTVSRFSPKAPPGAGSGAAKPIQIIVECNTTKKPVTGAIVTAFTNFASNEGAEALTDKSGSCDLDLGKLPVTLDRLYVYPPTAGFWGSYQTSFACNGNFQIALEPVQSTYTDVLAHFYGSSTSLTDGQGITVGIVDTGIDDSHADLAHVTYGENTAKGEPAKQWQDNGTGHGTHVAGIIGGRGTTRSGLAPGVELCSFRAFPKDSFETTNYQILKALMRAVDHGCHLVNLSLSSESRADETLRSGLQDAKDHGVLVIVAAGNEAKTQVSYPAFYAFSEGLSVSAMGRKGTFPNGSHEVSDVGTKIGTADPDNFIARFTNTGDVSLVGPGVGIISTVPGGYGVMSGTSMACPAVTGMVARVLSEDLQKHGKSSIIEQAPDANRTSAMINRVSGKASKIFNDAKAEGDGLIQ